jgi:hypothetical protein
MHAKLSCPRVGFFALLSLITRLSGQQQPAQPAALSPLQPEQPLSVCSSRAPTISGAYVIPLLPPGVYTVATESTGFAKPFETTCLCASTRRSP